jgi:hypothetical protein
MQIAPAAMDRASNACSPSVPTRTFVRMLSTAPIHRSAPRAGRPQLRLVPPPRPRAPRRARALAAYSLGLCAGLVAVAAALLITSPEAAALHVCLAAGAGAIAAMSLARTRAYARRMAQIRY